MDERTAEDGHEKEFQRHLDVLKEHLKKSGLKFTRQRENILRGFLAAEGHVSVEELVQLLHTRGTRIGASTVYRTVKLFADAGVAHARDFGDGHTRYEPVQEDHHDHLLCQDCGRIVEFEDDELEERQLAVARALGFRLAHHRMELFGRCLDAPDCPHLKDRG